MNPKLLKFLIENHTIDGVIKIDESDAVLDVTVSLINRFQSTDIDVIIADIIDPDLIEELVKNLVLRDTQDVVSAFLELERLAEVNLIETINRLLRAEL